MFTPQLYLYEQVRQQQAEMERRAQQDLQIYLADEDASSPKSGGRKVLGRLRSALQSWINISTPGFPEQALNASLKIEHYPDAAKVKLS
jgi:hypothetical protein